MRPFKQMQLSNISMLLITFCYLIIFTFLLFNNNILSFLVEIPFNSLDVAV